MIAALIPVAQAVIAQALKMIADAEAASKEQLAQIEARLQAALGALSGTQAQTHAEMAARLADVQTLLASLQPKPAASAAAAVLP